MSIKTLIALAEARSGMKSAYRAAKDAGVSLSTIYRAIRRVKELTVKQQ